MQAVCLMCQELQEHGLLSAVMGAELIPWVSFIETPNIWVRLYLRHPKGITGVRREVTSTRLLSQLPQENSPQDLGK